MKTIEEIFNESMDHFFYLFNYFLNQITNVEKSHILNFFKYDMFKKHVTDCRESFENKINNAVPSKLLYIKLLFPILSPFYYTLGFPIIKIFSETIINNIIFNIIFKDLDKELNEFSYLYLKNFIVLGLNDGIEGLNKISKKFQNHYVSKKLENKLYEILFEEKNNIIEENNFNTFLDDLLKTTTGNDILKFVNNFFKENEEFLSSNDDRNKKDMILKLIEKKLK